MENFQENVAASSVQTAVKQNKFYKETHGTGVMSSIIFVILAIIFMASLASYIH